MLNVTWKGLWAAGIVAHYKENGTKGVEKTELASHFAYKRPSVSSENT